MCLADLPTAVVPLWQVTQPLTMPERFILVSGIVTVLRWRSSLCTYAALLRSGFASAMVLPLWQVAQPLVMPVCFITVLANGTVGVWQVSQAALVGMCLADLPTVVIPLWQVTQPLTMPVWFILVPANDTVLRWQFSQGIVVGMGAAVLASTTGLPLWHRVQRMVMAGCVITVLALGDARLM